jgi:hypothetical protein
MQKLSKNLATSSDILMEPYSSPKFLTYYITLGLLSVISSRDPAAAF